MQWQDEIKTLAGFTEAELQDPRLWELMVMTARACIDLVEDRIEFLRLTQKQRPLSRPLRHGSAVKVR